MPNPKWLLPYGRQAVGALRNLGADRSVVRKAIGIEREYPGVLGLIDPKASRYHINKNEGQYGDELFGITTPKKFLDLALEMDDPYDPWTMRNIEYLHAIMRRRPWQHLLPYQGQRPGLGQQASEIRGVVELYGETPPGFGDMPFLRLRRHSDSDTDWRVTGHESRHRARAARDAGVEDYPLRLVVPEFLNKLDEARALFDEQDPYIFSEYGHEYGTGHSPVGRFSDLFKLPAMAPLMLDEEE